MKVESKFTPGDYAYLMHDNKVVFGKIEKVELFNPVMQSADYEPQIRYHIEVNCHQHVSTEHRYENDVFKTKEELLKSL